MQQVCKLTQRERQLIVTQSTAFDVADGRWTLSFTRLDVDNLPTNDLRDAVSNFQLAVEHQLKQRSSSDLTIHVDQCTIHHAASFEFRWIPFDCIRILSSCGKLTDLTFVHRSTNVWPCTVAWSISDRASLANWWNFVASVFIVQF